MRSRTYSKRRLGESSDAGRSIYSNLASGRKSIGSRKSTARSRPAVGPRQSSAASFVSDVTSEVSRRLSMMSDADEATTRSSCVPRCGCRQSWSAWPL